MTKDKTTLKHYIYIDDDDEMISDIMYVNIMWHFAHAPRSNVKEAEYLVCKSILSANRSKHSRLHREQQTLQTCEIREFICKFTQPMNAASCCSTQRCMHN